VPKISVKTVQFNHMLILSHN